MPRPEGDLRVGAILPVQEILYLFPPGARILIHGLLEPLGLDEIFLKGIHDLQGDPKLQGGFFGFSLFHQMFTDDDEHVDQGFRGQVFLHMGGFVAILTVQKGSHQFQFRKIDLGNFFKRGFDKIAPSVFLIAQGQNTAGIIFYLVVLGGFDQCRAQADHLVDPCLIIQGIEQVVQYDMVPRESPQALSQDGLGPGRVGISVFPSLMANFFDLFFGFVQIKIEKLGHNWNDGVTTPSTCQKQGNILYTCLRCGGTKTVMLELAQHTMVLDTEASKAATCTSRGYETYKCSADGCTYGYSILGDKPTGHQKTKVETTASTCKMSGMKKTICEDCNTILSVEVLPLAEHTYSSTVKAPTCTEMGYTVYACDVCGNTYKDDYKSAVPHNFDETITENVTIVDATCTTDGSKTVKCKDCDATDVTTLPATGHINTRVETVPSTCIKKGTEKVICACGVTVSEKELPLTDHNYEVTYENGVYTYTCKQEGCKHSYTETVDIRFTVRFFAADKKTVIKTESVILNGAATAPDAPAKVADGSYHYTFSEWDRSFTAITSDLDVYPIYEKEAHYGGEATCTEKALCEECNTPYGETDSSKHVMATKLTPATCENDGELLHYCTESGCAYSYTEAVNKLGHSFGKWETYQNGNCATPYISIRKCQNYGCKEYEQRESYGSHTWYIQPEIAPTCTTVGYSAYKYCTTCGIEVESVVIPKLEHQDNNGDGSCDYCAYTESVPTCNCMCHSTGFMKFIYSIVRFFWMITKSTPSCSCGARHY